MRAFPLLACLLAASALLSGCAGVGRPSADDGPGSAALADATAGGQSSPAGQAGLVGPLGQPGRSGQEEPDGDDEDLVVVLDQEFLIDSTQGAGALAFKWPRGGWSYMALEYSDGAFADAAFALGGCEEVTPIEGAAVLVGGQGATLLGSMSIGVLYECGWLDAGAQQVAWTLGAGVLGGRVQVYAEP